MALNFPNSPTVGQVYTDTTSGFSYEWDGTVWKSYSPASASNIKILDDVSGSFNGSTQTFALTSNGVALTPANAQSLLISLGGVVQEPGADYTVNTTNITFTTAPDAALSFSGVSLGPAVPITYANDGVIYIRNTYTGAGTSASPSTAGDGGPGIQIQIASDPNNNYYWAGGGGGGNWNTSVRAGNGGLGGGGGGGHSGNAGASAGPGTVGTGGGSALFTGQSGFNPTPSTGGNAAQSTGSGGGGNGQSNYAAWPGPDNGGGAGGSGIVLIAYPS